MMLAAARRFTLLQSRGLLRQSTVSPIPQLRCWKNGYRCLAQLSAHQRHSIETHRPGRAIWIPLASPSLALGSRVARKHKHSNTQLPPRRKIDESEIEENFVKGTGPGGQKINKTSSAVQLIHIPTNTVVKCQETRSRSQNRKLARQLLAEKLDLAEKGDESRLAIKADRARKKKYSADKKKRRKYRKLDTAAAATPATSADVNESSEAAQGENDHGMYSPPSSGDEKRTEKWQRGER